MAKVTKLNTTKQPRVVQTQYSVPQSTGATRAFFLEAMVAVARDEMDHAKAQAIARLGQQAYNFSKLELRAAEISAKNGNQIINSWEFKRDPPRDIQPPETNDQDDNDRTSE